MRINELEVEPLERLLTRKVLNFIYYICNTKSRMGDNNNNIGWNIFLGVVIIGTGTGVVVCAATGNPVLTGAIVSAALTGLTAFLSAK